jgi:integrase
MKGKPLTERQKFQKGSLRKVDRKKGSAVWEYRYRDHSRPGSPMRQLTISTELYPTESKALTALQPMLLKINGEEAYTQRYQTTVGTLVERYIESEGLREVKAMPPGEAFTDGVQFSTACSYLTTLDRYIKPRWGDVLLTEVKPTAVDEWLKSLTKLRKPGEAANAALEPLSPKTKGNIKSMLYRLFERAMFWELVPLSRNPIELVEIRGVSKRKKKPFILTVEQYHAVVNRLEAPYKQMVQVAMCLGLRVNEVLALKWADFNFDSLSLQVSRGIVHGRVSRVKTEYSEDELPLDPDFVEVMLEWMEKCPETEGDWVFPNPSTLKPYHSAPIQQDYIRAAGRAVGLSGDIGWHTFRHTYRSLLDDAGAPIGVQQKLMRHAQVSTTMNVYGNSTMQSKRSANTKVVQMVLPKAV